MKTWNAPVMRELDVRLTAHGFYEGTSEVDNGYVNNEWTFGSYDSATTEMNPGGCWGDAKTETGVAES